MTPEPRLELNEIDWLLRVHLRPEVVAPTNVEDRLLELGLMERKATCVAVSDPGRNWLAHNGYLRWRESEA